MFSTNNACYNIETLNEKAESLQQTGPLLQRRPLHPREDGRSSTCPNGELKTRTDKYFIIVNGKDINKNEVVRCAGDIISKFGCCACLQRDFLVAWNVNRNGDN